MTKIPIELNGGIMPTKGSRYAAAFDVCCPEDFEINDKRSVVGLKFCIELPVGWKANIRPRSGYSAKGMEVEVRTKYRRYNGEEYVTKEAIRLDADVLLGLIDSDFRGEVGVIVKADSIACIAHQVYEFDTILENHVYITKGTRLAQMEICGGDCELVEVEKINRDIDRGGGFGHTNEQG